MLCKMVMAPRKKKTGSVPVYLNVYDLTPINGYAYWFGLGIYHSGVQVHGVEYGFGAHDHSTTGIFEVEPKRCPGFTFRKSILIGRTDLGPKEVRTFMEKLAEDYSGNTYHLITKNCNHFCNDVCLKLTKKPIPPWVNRLARLGFFCNCVLPAGLNETKVRQVRSDVRDIEGEKKKLKSHSSRYVASSDPLSGPKLSSCPSGSGIRSNGRQRRCIPSSSTLVHSSSTSTLSLKL
ncbi:deSI-like protein At4g17486 [Mangifera indica]|uniref:deSI-like protein At4g17486 n=1 Tax=Mangifera indica TaxID=29780 RepID=UPI001CFAD16B|nr:deSI-like protein At4g17486 [Mangifera indica]